MIDFTPLTTSKVTQGEFAALLRVSRVAVSGWVHGRTGVHEMRAPRVIRLLKVLDQATQDNKLPLRGIPRAQRMDALKKVLVSYLRKPS